MSAAQEYRQRAAECLRLTELIRDPRYKALLYEMAAMWLRLAEYAEERRDTVR